MFDSVIQFLNSYTNNHGMLILVCIIVSIVVLGLLYWFDVFIFSYFSSGAGAVIVNEDKPQCLMNYFRR